MSLMPPVVILIILLSFPDSQGFLFGKHNSHEDSKSKSKSSEFHLPFLGSHSHSSSHSHESPDKNKPPAPVPDELNPNYFCQGPCKDGWISYLDYCHIYVSKQLAWKDAETHCQSLFSRAHLTSVQSEMHNKFLIALAESKGSRDDNFWTGANSEKGSNSWADGSPLKFLKLPGNILNKIFGGKLCLSLKLGGDTFWNQLSCTQKLPFICIYKPTQPWG
ncbi:snaclec botrocetin subunit alpha-like [Hyperolius riggenbachi]|uniref:snaclec botrocetin subunit alpha-like n=1 Tax=Hyperolius riggenbachi TaxID=752182 RepID=UPI0035A36B37